MVNLEQVRHQVAIAGQVSDAETGQVIAKALVEITEKPDLFARRLQLCAIQYGNEWEKISNRPDRRITATDGYFYFLDLPDGNYTLNVSMPSAGTRYGQVCKSVEVRRGDSSKITPPGGNFALPPTGIKGQIAGADNQPIVMAKVRVEGSQESASSNSLGNYLLRCLEATLDPSSPRTVNVSVSVGGKQIATDRIQISQGEIQTLDFKVE